MTLHKVAGLLASSMAVLAAGVTTAGATPFTVEYTVSGQEGGKYLYDIDVILDNHDGSWEEGQQFDWFSFGNQLDGEEGSGAFGDPVVVSAPDGLRKDSVTYGGFNGPTLCYGRSCFLSDGGYEPSLNEVLSLQIVASVFLGEGELLWSNYSASANNDVKYEVAILKESVSEVPLPAGAALFMTGLGAIAVGRRRKASA